MVLVPGYRSDSKVEPTRREEKLSYSKTTLVAMYSLILILSIWVSDSIGHEWMAPKSIARVKNPIELNQASAEKGRNIYAENCAVCHGNTLEGLSADEIGLERDSPNLKKRIKTHSDGDFFWKIQQGRGNMPSFAEALSDKEIWEVINYIRVEAR